MMDSFEELKKCFNLSEEALQKIALANLVVKTNATIGQNMHNLNQEIENNLEFTDIRKRMANDNKETEISKTLNDYRDLLFSIREQLKQFSTQVENFHYYKNDDEDGVEFNQNGPKIFTKL